MHFWGIIIINRQLFQKKSQQVLIIVKMNGSLNLTNKIKINNKLKLFN